MTQRRPAEIVLIAAVARNGAIGRGNELLFKEPADQRRFRAVTLGCPVIMGRRTWQSLPPRFRPLPGRRNIVLSRTGQLEVDAEASVAGAAAMASATSAEVADDLATALHRVHAAPRVFIIGGAAVYAAAMPLADTLMLTEIDAELDGDRHFPPWDRTHFDEVERSAGAITNAGLQYAFVTYRRRVAAATTVTPNGGAAPP